jgi:hypothetical protein
MNKEDNETSAKEDHLHDQDSGLVAEVRKDGVVFLSVAGKFGHDELFSVIAWTEKVKRILREESAKHEGEIPLLCDLAGLRFFDRSMIAPLRELLAYDAQFRLRSAISGCSPIVDAMIRALLSITKRTNVRLFATEKEALAWLSGKEERGRIN